MTLQIPIHFRGDDEYEIYVEMAEIERRDPSIGIMFTSVSDYNAFHPDGQGFTPRDYSYIEDADDERILDALDEWYANLMV